MTMSTIVEYRVQPVTRYLLTLVHATTNAAGLESGGCELIGEFNSKGAAERVATALRGGGAPDG